MSQYERMVSYLYAYRDGEKGANVGYARVENRGDRCRITVQMRAVAVQNPPVVYFYQQKKHGIETLLIGNMSARGTNLVCKVVTDGRNLCTSGKALDDMDGIYIDIESNVCYSTTWKNDYFYRGDWTRDMVLSQTKEDVAKAIEEKTEKGRLVPENKTTERVPEKKENESFKLDAGKEKIEEYQKSDIAAGKIKEALGEVSRKTDKKKECIEERETTRVEEIKAASKEKKDKKTDTSQVEMQSICGVCPFKNEMYDYGQKMLRSFPTMKPFCAGFADACVRIELQDIGCLPMTFWSLSGNRFLLHGYYCYRHLVFIQLSTGEYVLGVPGIYNEKEKKNARSFGFCDFQSIGEFGKMQGAFGYWLMRLPEK